MRHVLFLFALLLAALLLTGCAHPAPRVITLPTTAVIGAHIAAAKTTTTKAAASNARVAALAHRAVTVGILAGSTEAKELASFSTDTSGYLAQLQLQLATLKTDKDQLTAQLLAAQKQVDDQTTRVASLTTKLNAAEKTIWWYRLRFWGPLVFALLAVGVFVVARFTAWGARTLGPYLVDAEHLAVKAAVLA